MDRVFPAEVQSEEEPRTERQHALRDVHDGEVNINLLNEGVNINGGERVRHNKREKIQFRDKSISAEHYLRV